MQIFNKLTENKNLAIAMGFFDGIHIGHLKVLNSAIDYAKKNGLKSAVVTFRDKPSSYFTKDVKYILTQKKRLYLFEKLGVDYLYLLDFDEYLANMSAEDYLEFVVKNLAPKSVSTGFNHTFGRNRQGTSTFLAKKSSKYNYEYFEIEAQKFENQIVSSTLIKELIQNGEVEKVNSLLFKPFSIEGEVVKGKQIGRTIGFNTANLIYPENLVELKTGVYSAKIDIAEVMYKAVVNFGIHPTLNNIAKPTLEAHILDFDENIYGDKIQIEFVKKIRDDKKFNSLNELQQQISKDIEQC